MSERYPWEEGLPPAAADAAPGALPLQMELEAPLVSQPPQTSPGQGDDPGPPSIAPVVQPDGDPRRQDQVDAPAPAAPPPAGQPEPAEAPPARAPEDPPRPAARERSVARKEYYSIGEVSELAGLPPHVLRYWESQFPVLNPSKNRSGNRAYQRKEIKLILLVKHLLYEEKYTVEGAKAKLDQLRRGGLLAEHTARALDTQTLALLREDVARLRELLSSG